MPLIKKRFGFSASCHICGKRYKYGNILRKHLLSHDAERHQLYSPANVTVLRSNPDQEDEVIEVSEVECDLCGRKLNTPDEEVEHIRQHGTAGIFMLETRSGEKLADCATCIVGFSDDAQLERHLLSGRHNFRYKGTVGVTAGRSSRGQEAGVPVDLPNNSPTTERGFGPSQADLLTNQGLFNCPICHKLFYTKLDLETHIHRHRKSEDGVKPHACTICERRFTLACHLAKHMVVHRTYVEAAGSPHQQHWQQSEEKTQQVKRAHVCGVCHKGFTSEHILQLHMIIHGAVKPFACTQCDKRFQLRQSLQRHILSHSGHRPYECDQCGSRFKHKHVLKMHQRIHTGERPYACQFCDKKFAMSGNLTRHMVVHSGEGYTGTQLMTAPSMKPFLGRRGVKCKICFRKFSRRQYLNQHMKAHNRRPGSSLAGGAMSGGVMSGGVMSGGAMSGGVMSGGAMSGGVMSGGAMSGGVVAAGSLNTDGSQPDPSLQCRVCFRQFFRRQALVSHMRVHGIYPSLWKRKKLSTPKLAGKERNLQCNYCERRFTTKQYLVQHVRSHLETEKKYKCTFCPRGFTRRQYLLVHMRSHGQSVAQPDPVDSTSSAHAQQETALTADTSQLQGSPSDASKKQHHCKYCLRLFTRVQALIQHMRRHGIFPNRARKGAESSSLSPQLQCAFCERVFLRAQGLASHMRVHVGEVASPTTPYIKQEAGEPAQEQPLQIEVASPPLEAKPFECEVCHRQFTRKPALYCHMRVHAPSRSPAMSTQTEGDTTLSQQPQQQHKQQPKHQPQLLPHQQPQQQPQLQSQQQPQLLGPPPQQPQQLEPPPHQPQLLEPPPHQPQLLELPPQQPQLLEPPPQQPQLLEPPQQPQQQPQLLEPAPHQPQLLEPAPHQPQLLEPAPHQPQLLEPPQQPQQRPQLIEISPEQPKELEPPQQPKQQPKLLEPPPQQPQLLEPPQQPPLLEPPPQQRQLVEPPSPGEAVVSADGVDNLECDVCHLQFTRRAALVSHMNVHSNEAYLSDPEAQFGLNEEEDSQDEPTLSSGVNDLKCGVCGRQFWRKQALASHMRVHADKPASQLGSPDTASPMENFDCSLCERQFTRKQALYSHMRVHSNKADSSLVNVKTENLAGEDQHMDDPTSTSPAAAKDYECFVCHRQFARRQALYSHMRVHADRSSPGSVEGSTLDSSSPALLSSLDSFECSVCFRLFTRKTALVSHMRVHRVDPTESDFSPPDVGLTPSTPAQHPSDQLLMTPARVDSFQCEICYRLFSRKTALVSHLRMHSRRSEMAFSNTEQEMVAGEQEQSHGSQSGGHFECQYCFRQFSRKTALVSHLRVHFDKTSPDFANVNPNLGGSSEREEEEGEHGGVTGGGLECEVCHRQFSRKQALVSHMRVHMGKNTPSPTVGSWWGEEDEEAEVVGDEGSNNDSNPFLCPWCGRGFPSGSGLRRHIMIHTNERPYSCNICRRAFNQASTLKRHLCTHTKAGPAARSSFQPDQANESATVDSELLLQTEIEFLSCVFCANVYPTLEKLEEHMLTHDENKADIVLLDEVEGESSVSSVSCTYCSMSFPHTNLLTRHVRSCHQNPDRMRREAEEEMEKVASKEASTGSFSCYVCFKPFTYLRSLEKHILKHLNDSSPTNSFNHHSSEDEHFRSESLNLKSIKEEPLD